MTIPVEDRLPTTRDIILQVNGKLVLLDRLPIVLTKDRTFANRVTHRVAAGDVIILPTDAVLVMLPEGTKS